MKAREYLPRYGLMTEINELRTRLAEAEESLHVLLRNADQAVETIECKLAEESARQNEERLRLAVEVTGLGTWDYDLLNGTASWSDNMKSIFGLGDETKASYERWLSYVHPDDRERMDKVSQSIKDPGGDGEYRDEYRIIRPDGSMKWVDSNGRSFYEEINGKRCLVRFFGTVVDITERKLSAEKERHSKEFLEKVLESLTHPFYVIDAKDYSIKMANSASCFGELNETCTCYGLTHKRNEPCGGEHPCPLQEVKRTKQPVVMEHIHYDKNGNLRNMEVHGYPILDDDGNVTEMIEYCLDITERKHAEEEVIVSQLMLRLVMDNIPQHIFWKNKDSVYLGCNKNFAEDAGLNDPADIVGKTDYDLPWKKEEADLFRDYDRRVMNEDTPILHIIEPQLQADGREAWLDTNKIPLHDAKGNVVGILGTYEDITERKLVEVEKENARKALEEVYERERRIAVTLQRSFLPDRIPELEGYQLAQAYYPALSEAAIGGDVYDIFKLPNGKVGMVIADVSGKGLRAARYGAMIKYMLRAYSYRADDPAEILTLLNSSILVEMDIDSFVTCFFGILDPNTGVLVYANAGHDQPLYVPHRTGVPVRVQVTGPILGLLESSTYTYESITLCKGDILLLYTDGVTDARGAQSPMYIEGLEEYLSANCALSADALVECVLEEVRRRSGDKLADDVAMIALEVVEQPGDR